MSCCNDNGEEKKNCCGGGCEGGSCSTEGDKEGCECEHEPADDDSETPEIES